MLACNVPPNKAIPGVHVGLDTCTRKPWILTDAISWNTGSISVILCSLELANADFTPV